MYRKTCNKQQRGELVVDEGQGRKTRGYKFRVHVYEGLKYIPTITLLMLQIGAFWSAFCNKHDIHGCCFEKKNVHKNDNFRKNNVNNCVFF